MFTIEFDPCVLAKLRKAYPKPPLCADKALEKYRVLLEGLLFKAIQRGRSAYENRFDLYSIPVADLTHQGPQLSMGKVRLHAWLKANDLELVKKIEEGNNLNGLVSKIKLSDLVSIKEKVADLGVKLASISVPEEVDSILTGDKVGNAKLFNNLFPDYFSYFPIQKRADEFDLAPIDMGSLQAYIVWLNTKAKKLKPTQILNSSRQAMLIHSVAKHTGGWLPMRKKPSDFGRTYYAGTSVQNVNKTLRRAMLGDCWEYDIKSAVIAWKLTFAEELAKQLDPNKNYERQFWASILYVNGRKEFMRDVRVATFGNSSEIPKKVQDSKIKQAITAIGFGARAQSNGWRIGNGEWMNPSLVNIIQDAGERQQFLDCPVIEQFIREQVAFDKYLEQGMKNDLPDVYYGPLITSNINPSRSKAVAYLYQHQETEAMNVARAVLEKYSIEPIANIHDAFIVKHRLSINVVHEIILEMRAQMQNSYFSIKGTKLEGFKW